MTVSSTARGYGASHVVERRRLVKILKAVGAMPCADPAPRCPGMLVYGQPMDLAHDHYDRSRYLGLAHAYCNRWHAAQKANRSPRRPGRRAAMVRRALGVPSRQW